MLLFLGIPRKRPKKPTEDVQADFEHEALTPDDSKRHLATQIQPRINVVDDEPEILDYVTASPKTGGQG